MEQMQYTHDATHADQLAHPETEPMSHLKPRNRNTEVDFKGENGV